MPIDKVCRKQTPQAASAKPGSERIDKTRIGLTKPGSERIDKTRIKLKTFVFIRMFAYMLGSIREEYRFCP
jgi:hypothetical protein